MALSGLRPSGESGSFHIFQVQWDQAALSISREPVSHQPSPIWERLRNEKWQVLPTGLKHTQIDPKSQTNMLILISSKEPLLGLERWHKELRGTLSYQGARNP